jgi:hypothetical protein
MGLPSARSPDRQGVQPTSAGRTLAQHAFASPRRRWAGCAARTCSTSTPPTLSCTGACGAPPRPLAQPPAAPPSPAGGSPRPPTLFIPSAALPSRPQLAPPHARSPAAGGRLDGAAGRRRAGCRGSARARGCGAGCAVGRRQAPACRGALSGMQVTTRVTRGRASMVPCACRGVWGGNDRATWKAAGARTAREAGPPGHVLASERVSAARLGAWAGGQARGEGPGRARVRVHRCARPHTRRCAAIRWMRWRGSRWAG